MLGFYEGDKMNYKDKLFNHLQAIIGKQLTELHLACEMMMFSFDEFALHTQCLTRIIHEEDVLVTTLDYHNWDGKDDKNNDEWYFIKQYKESIVGGIVTSINVSSLYDVIIVLDNGIKIELINKNGYHHFDDESEQWRFFKPGDYSYPHITVYSKTVDIAVNW